MPLIKQFQDADGSTKALHEMNLYLPGDGTRTRSVVKGRAPRALGTAKVLTPDNRPSVGEQLRTCGNCRYFEPKTLEAVMKEGVGTFLQKEACLLPDPDKGHSPPPPGYEVFRPAEAGYCHERDAKFLAQRYGTCDGWRPNPEALKPWLRNFACAEALEWEEQRQRVLSKRREKEREAERAETLRRKRGLLDRIRGR